MLLLIFSPASPLFIFNVCFDEQMHIYTFEALNASPTGEMIRSNLYERLWFLESFALQRDVLQTFLLLTRKGGENGWLCS